MGMAQGQISYDEQLDPRSNQKGQLNILDPTD
jgi:hypothetical protein